MSRFELPSLRLGALLLTLAFAASVPAAAETIRLRADTWMPYNGDAAAAGSPPGYVVELARKIFEPAGIEIDYRNLAWGEALKAATAGEIEGVISASPAEAVELVLPQESVGAPRVALFVRKGATWRYENVPLLARVRLGVVLDYRYWDSLDAYIEKHDAPHVTRFSGAHPLTDAIDRLDEGKLDVVAECVPVFLWTLRVTGRVVGDYARAYEHNGDPIFVAFSPRGEGARYARMFDEGLRRLRRSGELAAILARYGQSDWAE